MLFKFRVLDHCLAITTFGLYLTTLLLVRVNVFRFEIFAAVMASPQFLGTLCLMNR